MCHIFISQGKTIDFAGVDDSTARWVQEFSVKPYASPAKLESIDGVKSVCSYETECISVFMLIRMCVMFQVPVIRRCWFLTVREPWMISPTAGPSHESCPTSFLSKVRVSASQILRVLIQKSVIGLFNPRLCDGRARVCCGTGRRCSLLRYRGIWGE